MRDLGLLIVRLTTGGLLIGHGTQKLFGWFGGYGIDGTAGWLESLGVKPGRPFAWLAGLGELGGGLLTALGLLHPVGSIALIGPMAVASGTVHRGKPIWVFEGGAELPVTNIALGLGLALTGPGRYSLDEAFGLRAPKWLVGLVAAALVVGTAFALPANRPAETPAPEAEEAGAELQSGIGASEVETS